MVNCLLNLTQTIKTNKVNNNWLIDYAVNIYVFTRNYLTLKKL